MNFRWIPITLALTLATASAASSPQAITDYRQATMSALGKHMKATSMVAKGQVDRPMSELLDHAEAMQGIARMIGGMFPDGTGPAAAKTGALATIWTDKAGFDAAAARLVTETDALVATAKANDLEAYKAQVGKVGKACGACHDTYKSDDE